MAVPAHWVALRTRRFMHEHGINQDPLRAVAMADYYHAQFNPRAVMYGHPLTREEYDNSRWIAEPFHLYDCCMENDGAAAVILTTAERARDLKQKPVYVMAAAQGAPHRGWANVENAPDYASSNFKTLAPRLYEMAGITPKDVDVAQVYEHFSGAVMISMVEHGFCQPDEVMEFVTFENITAPNGKLPINTSGGNIAECYMHGLELVTEAVRQCRGTSTCQVPDAKISLVVSGPMVAPVSDLIASWVMPKCQRKNKSKYYLPAGLPGPAAERNGMDKGFWDAVKAAQADRPALQRMRRISSSAPNGFAIDATATTSDGIACRVAAASTVGCASGIRCIPRCKRRVPLHRAGRGACPTPATCAMVGNLLGDPQQEPAFDAEVEAVFEDHDEGYTLVQWKFA